MTKWECMKKTFLLIAILSVNLALAQAPCHNYNGIKKGSGFSSVRHKTTDETHDSLYMYNLGPGDTGIYAYSLPGDSGLVSGTNARGYYGFAERYNYNGDDSAVTVIGVAAIFVGRVNPASTKTVGIKVWTAAGATPGSRPNLIYSGFPAVPLNCVVAPYTDLGISDSTVELREFYFVMPTPVSDTFFVGCTLNYAWDSLNGDTIGVATTKNGNRTSPLYTVAGADTTVNVQNTTLRPMDVWVDNGYDLGLSVNYWLFPIVNTTVISHTGIIRNDFTFYGNYPNPAVNYTAVKFALAHSSGVTIQVIDPHGRNVSVISEPVLAAGEHIISLSTANLPSGSYLYVIRTADGDGIAGKISVIR
jgi:hypothetical protein